ncbi:hypothetical protein [Nonomuraea sp. NPDC049400]|uniref:hypothetical protein n=1 Tax=Nonomuraea sp. NPDC049400 TaxID=3364352 RepID=UPI00379FBB58
MPEWPGVGSGWLGRLREKTTEVIRFRLRSDPGVEEQVRDLATRENACCAFVAFDIASAVRFGDCPDEGFGWGEALGVVEGSGTVIVRLHVQPDPMGAVVLVGPCGDGSEQGAPSPTCRHRFPASQVLQVMNGGGAERQQADVVAVGADPACHLDREASSVGRHSAAV